MWQGGGDDGGRQRWSDGLYAIIEAESMADWCGLFFRRRLSFLRLSITFMKSPLIVERGEAFQ